MLKRGSVKQLLLFCFANFCSLTPLDSEKHSFKAIGRGTSVSREPAGQSNRDPEESRRAGGARRQGRKRGQRAPNHTSGPRAASMVSRRG